MTLRTLDHLAKAGFVEPSDLLTQVVEKYAVAITPHIADLISQTGAQGGIGLQFIPSTDENLVSREQLIDPIADRAQERVPGLIHRYRDRVLLKVIHACPVYCRFCFRREMVGPQGEAMTAANLQNAYDYLHARPEIFEVILTGGDPFLFPPTLKLSVRSLLFD